MTIVHAICTVCQGIHTVDDQKDAAICPLCGEAYVVERAVRRYRENFPSWDDEKAYSDFIIDDQGVLTAYHGQAETVILPPEVKAIGDEAFAYCTSIRRVEIPASVETIGDCAFLKCTQLAEVILADASIQISSNAFWDTPYFQQEIALRQAESRREQQAFWRRMGRCKQCGGPLRRNVCKDCGWKQED